MKNKLLISNVWNIIYRIIYLFSSRKESVEGGVGEFGLGRKNEREEKLFGKRKTQNTQNHWIANIGGREAM